MLVSLHIYKFIWPHLKIKKVPTGAGILFFMSIFLAFYLNNELFSTKFGISISIISFLTLIYYIDDLKSLSISVRIFLQSLMGLAISFTFFFDIFNSNLYLFIFLLISISILSLLLTNTINFYDGADLNIVVFGILNFLVLYYIFFSESNFQIIIQLSLIFFIAFSFLNYKKNNLYFGDAGSFFLAGVLLIFISYAIFNQNSKILYLLTSLSLPILDVIFVILFRISRNEPLHTRHYHQIYQVVQKTQKNWLYLIIQPINTGISVLFILFLNILGINEILSIILGCLIISFIFYFSLRYFLVNNIKLNE